MAIAPIYNFIRIIPREADYLDKKYGKSSPGEDSNRIYTFWNDIVP
jgi:hypothetical protein